MKKLNEIDRLAQEKLKNLEIEAPELIWTNIERELKKKKDRKIVPFWWKYATVAAVLLIGIFIGTQFTNSSKINLEPYNLDVSAPIVQETIKNNSNNSNNKNPERLEIDEPSNNLIQLTNKKKVVENDVASSYSALNVKKVTISNQENNDDKIAVLKNNNINVSITNKNSNDEINSENKIDLVHNSINDKKTIANNGLENNNKTSLENVLLENQKNAIQTKTDLTITDKIALKKDSISKKLNVLENILAGKNNKKQKITKVNRWQITPNIAPIFANSTSNNSTIDSKFDNNAKSYEKNISVGLAVNYAINKKIKIRTGINQFDVDYNTNNIGFYKNVANSNNLEASNSIIADNYTISNNTTQILNFVPTSTGLGVPQTTDASSVKTEGSLSQKSSYLEVPLEVAFVVSSKKFGINIITGFSTLILNKNQFSIVANSGTIDLGQAENLNKIHYSTNIGLGLNYKFAPSFQINLEPMLKYQINTYNGNSLDSKPYFIGIYSGISYGF